MKKHAVLVVGARPNFMKAAPLIHAMLRESAQFEITLIHTGQHYDYNLSQLFFEDLNIPKSDIYLGVGSGSHAEQTANVMVALEKELINLAPDVVIVFGDINSTLATAVVTAKLGIKLAHVEAGLRSFDNRMPEEINRIVTDRLADFHFVTEQAGVDNLVNEGIDKKHVIMVGNIMIDSLKQNLSKLSDSKVISDNSLIEKKYVAVTMHRPSNVDNKERLTKYLALLVELSKKIDVVFPCHPRTLKMIEKFELQSLIQSDSFHLIEPLGYIDFLALLAYSKFVITDSGGIQGDTTYLKIPCLTIRSNTEQPETISIGSNTLCGEDIGFLNEKIDEILNGNYKQSAVPKFWDGATAQRIVSYLEKNL